MRLHVRPYFRGFKLAEVERPDVRRFYTKLEKQGRSPEGVRAIAAPLKALYATAVEDGIVQSNPTQGVRIMGKRESVEDVRERALSRVELARFLAAVDPEWRFFFEFLTQTGLRISEAIGLTVGDVEFGERPRIRLRRQLVRGEWDTLKSKAGKRDVPLSPGLSRVLWTRWAVTLPPHLCSPRGVERTYATRTSAAVS
jgi:integrase